MNEQNPPSPQDVKMDDLRASVERVAEKLERIAQAVKSLNQNRAQLEGKIEDAQKRIQHILSRLPEQSDGRQMNLLGEATPPTNLEDDNEPTTH
jgi:predicted  nucleic acid-binding Zn-ribbon protein